MIHRLVALMFIKNPKNKKTINHKNGIKTDNRVNNLEWNTHSENVLHSYRNGLQIPKGKATFQYSIEGNFIDEHVSQHEAQIKTGVHQTGISAACIGKQKTAGGFIWKYDNI